MSEPSYTFEQFLREAKATLVKVGIEKMREIWDKIYNQAYSDGFDDCLKKSGE